MNPETSDLLDDVVIVDPAFYRKKLLPLWIKIFAWIFLVAGGMAILSLIISFFVGSMGLSIYHIETNNPFSLEGLIVISIFLLKGITAYGLLWAKRWGVELAITDAVLGIIICGVIMFLPSFGEASKTAAFPLELLLLIPYLIKMLKIKSNWLSV